MHSHCDSERPVLKADLQALVSQLQELHSWAAASQPAQDDRRESRPYDGSMFVRGK